MYAHNLYDPLQSAYRAKHATETAIIKLNNDIIGGMDEGKCTILASYWIYLLPSIQLTTIYYFKARLGSSTVDQVLKYTKYPKYIPSTSTGQVLILLKST